MRYQSLTSFISLGLTKKMILISLIIGGLLGCLFGNFAASVYKSPVLISPAKIAGAFVINPKVTVTKLDMNSYYGFRKFDLPPRAGYTCPPLPRLLFRL